MPDIDKYLEIKRELLQAQLRVVYRHQRKTVPPGQKLKRTSNLTIVEDILQNSNQPIHISKIIQIAQKDYGQSSGKIRFFLKKKVASHDRMPSVGLGEAHDMK